MQQVDLSPKSIHQINQDSFRSLIWKSEVKDNGEYKESKMLSQLLQTVLIKAVPEVELP